MWRPEDVAAQQLACSRLSVYRRKREGEGLKKEDDMSGNGDLFSPPLFPFSSICFCRFDENLEQSTVVYFDSFK